MVEFQIKTSDKFEEFFYKIKDNLFKLKIGKQIKKIIENPEVGKPMKNVRKGTREVYISPYRLSYNYIKSENTIYFLDIYHKDKQ